MDKSSTVRRKAQQLAREGQVERAITELGRVLQAGGADPYDFVLYGDLLFAGKRHAEAIATFDEAMSVYEGMGLYRNAIAIGKKILRADPTRARTHQRLGELYAKEGFAGDAVTHFLTFLDKLGGEIAGEEFLATLERVGEISGPKVEVALRLADYYVRAGRDDRAAAFLRQVAQEAEQTGSGEIAGALRERAQLLLPEPQDGPTRFPPEEGDGSDGATGEWDSLVTDLAEPAEMVLPIASEEGPPALFAFDPSAIELVDSSNSMAEESETDGETEDGRTIEEDREEASLWSQIEQMESDERWLDAERLCEDLLETEPDHLDAAEKLVRIARIQGDTLSLVRRLSRLGDLRIAAHELVAACACFGEVLRLDPQDITARRRMARFREMGVADAGEVPEDRDGSIPVVLETQRAVVAVKDVEGVRSEEWVGLSSLLQEFREGIQDQISADDFTSHFDLGLGHLEMGLLEEALEAFDQVLLIKSIPLSIEIQAREMRGSCLCRLQRRREAIHEFRAALEVPGIPDEMRRAVVEKLASALEEAGERDEAAAVRAEHALGQSAPDPHGGA